MPPGEHRDGVPLDDDPDLHRLAERGQVEDAVHRLLERADGLDDEIVQARLGRVSGSPAMMSARPTAA